MTTERLRWVQNVSRLLLTRRSSASTMRAASCRKVVLRVQPMACSAFNGFPHKWLRSAGRENFWLNLMSVRPLLRFDPPLVRPYALEDNVKTKHRGTGGYEIAKREHLPTPEDVNVSPRVLR